MTIELSKETEQYLQEYLLREGLQPDAASNIVNTALEDFLFREMLRQAHERNKDLNPEEAEALIADVIKEDRAKQRMQKSN